MAIQLKNIKNKTSRKQSFGQSRLLSNLTTNNKLCLSALPKQNKSIITHINNNTHTNCQSPQKKLSTKLNNLLRRYLVILSDNFALLGSATPTFVVQLFSIKLIFAKAIAFAEGFSPKRYLAFMLIKENIKYYLSLKISKQNKLYIELATQRVVKFLNVKKRFRTVAILSWQRDVCFSKAASTSIKVSKVESMVPTTAKQFTLLSNRIELAASLHPNGEEKVPVKKQKVEKRQDLIIKKTDVLSSQLLLQGSGLKARASTITNKVKKNIVLTTFKNKNLFCLISIKRTKNNTHTTISNLFGGSKTRWSISAGQLKLPGGRRKTRLSQRLIYKSCLEKAISFGYKFAAIHCKGTRGSKVRIFRSFGSSLGVLLIKDTTGAAHNGCRPRKVRRV